MLASFVVRCRTILLVEDDPDIREALQMSLEFEGYRVATAANGKDGLERLATIETPCLILLDLMMPVMDGWAFAEALGTDMALAAIPYVLVTAYSDGTRPLKEARGVVKKPVDLDVLMKLVKQFCD